MKKVQKTLTAALAATLATGIVGSVANAETVNEIYNAAYNATQSALAKKDQVSINEARAAIAKLPAEYKNYASTFSGLVDTVQQPIYVNILSALEKAQKENNQANINAARKMLVGVEKNYANTWSAELDKSQQALIKKAQDACDKATKSGDAKDIKEAQALLADIKTVEGNEAVKTFVEKFETEFTTGLTITVLNANVVNSETLTVEFNREVDADTVVKENFVLSTKAGVKAYAKDVKPSEDKKKVTVTVAKMDASKDYTLTVKGVKDVKGVAAKEASFAVKYEKKEAAKVEFIRTKALRGEELKKLVKVTDAAGNDITKDVKIEFSSDEKNVVTSQGKVGSSVKFNKEITVKAAIGEVTAEEKVTVVDKLAEEVVGFTIGNDKVDSDTKMEDLTLNNKLRADANSKYLSLFVRNADGKVILLDGSDVTLKSSDEKVVRVSEGKLKGIAKGTAIVSVKYGNLETSIEVEVTKDAVADCNIELSSDTLTVVKGGVTKPLTFKVIDKFTGEKTTNYTAKIVVDDKTATNITVAGGKITPNGIADQVSAKLVVTVNGITFEKEFEVIVVSATKATGIEVVASDATLDIAEKESSDFTVYTIDENGNRVATLSDSNVELKMNNELVKKENGEYKINAVDLQRAYYEVQATYKVSDNKEFTNTVTIQVINSMSEKTSLYERVLTATNNNVDLKNGFTWSYGDVVDQTAIQDIDFGTVVGGKTTTGSSIVTVDEGKTTITVFVKTVKVLVNGETKTIDVYENKTFEIKR